MALRLWARSAANALKLSGTGGARAAAAPAFSISRFFSTGMVASVSYAGPLLGNKHWVTVFIIDSNSLCIFVILVCCACTQFMTG